MGKSIKKTNNLSTPELENALQQKPNLSYIHYLEHGTPDPLIRWHCHEAYELHLITETSGKFFVGDYIGRFKPGHLVLTGPHLPHNWISHEIPEEGIQIRDRVLQFPDEPIRQASGMIPELQEVLPLLERAKRGIEFRGISELTGQSMDQMLNSSGMKRFVVFLTLLSKLSRHKEYQLLSSAQLPNTESTVLVNPINKIMDYVSKNYSLSCTTAKISEHVGMSESTFLRYFQRTTGDSFAHFLYIFRINRACQMLMETEDYINTICYKVGFNNLASFNRRFMEVKGMTPSEFRKQTEERFG